MHAFHEGHIELLRVPIFGLRDINDAARMTGVTGSRSRVGSRCSRSWWGTTSGPGLCLLGVFSLRKGMSGAPLLLPLSGCKIDKGESGLAWAHLASNSPV